MVDCHDGSMKILLLDAETAQMTSAVAGQSFLLEHDVFLVDYLGSERERIPALKAIVHVRPTKANVDLLCRELRAPKYDEYYLCIHIRMS